MQLKIPKNTDKYFWTQHSIYKMKQYGLSEQRIRRVIRSPERTEKGIVKNTIAVMQPSSLKTKDGKRTWSQEIWAMYQTPKTRSVKSEAQKIYSSKSLPGNIAIQLKKVKIISAWRYPGVSPKNNPIPREILEELEKVS